MNKKRTENQFGLEAYKRQSTESVNADKNNKIFFNFNLKKQCNRYIKTTKFCSALSIGFAVRKKKGNSTE